MAMNNHEQNCFTVAATLKPDYSKMDIVLSIPPTKAAWYRWLICRSEHSLDCSDLPISTLMP